MLHLAECRKIREEVWNPIFEIIKEVDTRYTIDARLLITGAVDHENTIQPAHWDLIRITWRCIYAEIQRVRLEGVALDLKRVYQRTIRLFYGRVVAYAEKWRLWVLRNWHSDKPSSIPEKRRNKVYVEHDSEGTYCVNKILRDARMQLRRANRNARAP